MVRSCFILLTIQDLEKMQAAYPEYRMELVDGEIIVMSPSSYESELVPDLVVEVKSKTDSL